MASHLIVVLVLILVAGPASAGQQAQAPPAQKPVAASPSDASQIPVSIDDIKKGLEEPPQTKKLNLTPVQPTFTVHVYGDRPLLVPFKDTLKQPWEPIPPGGIEAYEFLNMVTPPQARPYGAFNSGELAQVALTSLLASLGMREIGKGVQSAEKAARARAEVDARAEIEGELAALKAANAAAEADGAGAGTQGASCGHPPGMLTPTTAGDTVTSPRLIKRVNPNLSGIGHSYPGGPVIVEAGVDEHGRVVSTCVVTGVDADVNKVTEDAVRQWLFVPAHRKSDGTPVGLVVAVAVEVHPPAGR